ncbi:hypothetical protein CR513_27428, partial [Mucuna pruriens]
MKNQVLYDVRRRIRPSVETLVELRRGLRERFILSYYTRDLYNKFQRLYQRSKNMVDYYKEVEMTLMRDQVKVSQEATMASIGKDKTRRRPNQNNQRRQRSRREDDLGGIIIKVHSFQVKSDQEDYLEWEMCVDKIFSCQSYSEGKRVNLATLEFTDYALIWWDQM